MDIPVDSLALPMGWDQKRLKMKVGIQTFDEGGVVDSTLKPHRVQTHPNKVVLMIDLQPWGDAADAVKKEGLSFQDMSEGYAFLRRSRNK